MPQSARPGPLGNRSLNNNQELDEVDELEESEFSAPSNGALFSIDIPPAPTQLVTLPTLTFLSQNMFGIGRATTYITDRDKANKKLVYLRTCALSRAHQPDFIFLQEIKRTEDPTPDLRRAINTYTPFVPSRRGDDQSSPEHDTAILVRNGLGDAILQTEVSTPRQTLLCIPSLNLLVANIHGPPQDGQPRRSFFDALLVVLSGYQREGWSVVIGGDFNIAPQPCDRLGGTRAESNGHIIQMLCDGLHVVDVADALYPHDPAHGPARHSQFTHSGLRDHVDTSTSRTTKVRTLISRIDLFLVPRHLARSPDVAYSTMDTAIRNSNDGNNILYDHKELFLHIPSSTLPPARAPPGFRLDTRRLDDPEFLAYLDETFRKALETIPDPLTYETASAEPGAPTQRNPFDVYHELILSIHNHCRQIDKRKDRAICSQVKKMHARFTELNKRSIHTDRAFAEGVRKTLEYEAILLTKQATQKAREKAAQVWLKHGDRKSEWTTAITRKSIARVTRNSIRALRPHNEPERVVSDLDDLPNIARDYYADMYAATAPPQAAIDHLLALHRASLDTPPPQLTERLKRTANPITLEDIDLACKKAGRNKAPGPGGMPAELFIHCKAARLVLHRIANFVLLHSHLITSTFTAGRIVILYKKGDDTSLGNYRPISLLNSDLKIITSILSARLATAISPFISPEQSAIIPGRSIRDNIYKVQLAQKYLEKAEETAIFMFLDQAKAYDRVAHSTLFQLLENFCLPPLLIDAIRDLYGTATSEVIVNGAASAPFPVQNGVRQGDALSCTLFVMVMELLGCALREHIPEDAFIELPSGTMTHACYMDDTVVTLCSNEFLPDLKRALDAYCAGTNAKFNEAKTEALFVGQSFNDDSPYVPCAEFPVTPVADGDPVRYLGTYIGNNVDYTALAERLIADVIAHGTRASRCHTTLRGRTMALTTFTIPKLTYHFSYLPINAVQAERAARQLSKLAWGDRRPYLNKNIMALPPKKGGFGYPNVAANRRAILLKLAGVASTHFNSLAFPSRHNATVPEWVTILRSLWHTGIRARSNPKLPSLLRSASDTALCNFYYNPFLQTSSAGRYAKGSFTQLWEYVFSNAFLSTQTYGVHYDASANFAPNMNLPLLSAGPWDPDAAEARLLGKVVNVESIAEPMTIASIRHIAPMIRSVNFNRLTKGDKETHAPMIIRLEQVYNDALAQKNELDSALHNLPPTYNLTFRHKDEPELSTPFKCWHSTRSTRALLQRVDPAPAFPKTDLDRHFSLLPVSRNSSEWALTESINALPQARSTLKRLLHKRMPARQGHITTCICAPAGTPAPRETVHHMLVECPAAKPFSSELFPKWIRLAQKLKPTVLYEHNIASLQPDADGCVYKLPPPASLPAELPTAPPSTELIPMAPFLKWLAFAVPTETTEHFHQLWQLASSTLIQLLWLQRNDLAYSEDRWSRERFITAYNSELTRYAQASTPPSSVVMRHLKEVLLDEPPPPTRRRHRHDSQSPATVYQPAISMQGNSPRSLQPPEPTPPALDLPRFDPTDP